MAIQLPSKIITPPVAAIPSSTFDSVWIQSINITSPTTADPITASVVVCPWNSTTNELYQAGSKMIYINDVFAESTSNPTLATAMEAIFAAVQNIIINKNIFGN